MMVYEFLPNHPTNGSLNKILHKNFHFAVVLSWKQRVNRILGVAFALMTMLAYSPASLPPPPYSHWKFSKPKPPARPQSASQQCVKKSSNFARTSIATFAQARSPTKHHSQLRWQISHRFFSFHQRSTLSKTILQCCFVSTQKSHSQNLRLNSISLLQS